MDIAERLQAFEACFNFRDLGGYEAADGRRVRWGRLFRSDTLHRLTDADLAAFGTLGLQTVVDLRSATEIDDHGALRPDARTSLEWHHVPTIDQVVLRPRDEAAVAPAQALDPVSMSRGELYLRMLGDGTGLAAVFRLLTEPARRPAVFHCTSGKDRTGMVAAMALDLLGVPDEVIAADYVLTNETRERSNEWIAAHEPVFAAYLAEIPPERRSVDPDIILGFLAGIRREHGSVRDLLVGHGLPPDALGRFRDDLLE
jgi:protein-tyrosine phosphatase